MVSCSCSTATLENGHRYFVRCVSDELVFVVYYWALYSILASSATFADNCNLHGRAVDMGCDAAGNQNSKTMASQFEVGYFIFENNTLINKYFSMMTFISIFFQSSVYI